MALVFLQCSVILRFGHRDLSPVPFPAQQGRHRLRKMRAVQDYLPHNHYFQSDQGWAQRFDAFVLRSTG